MQRIATYAASHVGKIRKVNEDAFFMDESGCILGVFDGVGSVAGGDLASKSAASCLKAHADLLWRDDLGPMVTRFQKFFETADKTVQEIGMRNPRWNGLGSTATIGFLDFQNDDSIFLHLGILGDSRAYLHRGQNLIQLGMDQSWYNFQLRDGIIPSEEESERYAHAIATGLGQGGSVEFDYYKFPLKSGDLLLFCTDGLSSYVPHLQIAGAISHRKLGQAIGSTNSKENLKNIVDELIEAANRRGGRDNITALIAQLPSEHLGQKIETDPAIEWVFGNHEGTLTQPCHIAHAKKPSGINAFTSNSLGHSSYLRDRDNFNEILELAGAKGATVLF